MELLLTNISNIGNALGWTLIHFLWQGILIFMGYWVITRLFLKNKINQQYWVGMFFIAICLVVPIREFIIQLHLIDNNTDIIQLISSNISASYSSGIMNPIDLMVLLIQKFIPYLVVIWLFSVLLISGHLFQSWLALLKLSKQPSDLLPKSLLIKLREVSRILKLKINPIITISEKIDIPATFGFFKPVILLPLSLISKLPQEQMEAILIHELCHIKRADFLHNILQLLVETLFFYHPLTKWLSKDIRKIREQCCDEMVLNLKTNPIVYANALTNIASIYNKNNNNDTSHLQIAAGDGELFNRIKFLMLDKRAKSPLTNIILGITFALIALVVLNNITSDSNNSGDFTLPASTTNKIVHGSSYNRPEYTTPNIYQLIEQQNKKEVLSIKATTVKTPAIEKAQSAPVVTLDPTKLEPSSAPIIQKSSEAPITEKIKTPLSNKSIVNKTSNNLIPPSTIKPSEASRAEQNRIVFPKLIKKVNPIYTRNARSSGIEGTVILSFNIDKKGRVKKINVDKSSPLKVLDGSAKSALHKWRFDPKSINVSNINHRYQQIFSFNLNKSDHCMAGSIGTRLATEKVCQDL